MINEMDKSNEPVGQNDCKMGSEYENKEVKKMKCYFCGGEMKNGKKSGSA